MANVSTDESMGRRIHGTEERGVIVCLDFEIVFCFASLAHALHLALIRAFALGTQASRMMKPFTHAIEVHGGLPSIPMSFIQMPLRVFIVINSKSISISVPAALWVGEDLRYTDVPTRTFFHLTAPGTEACGSGSIHQVCLLLPSTIGSTISEVSTSHEITQKLLESDGMGLSQRRPWLAYYLDHIYLPNVLWNV